MSRLCVNNRKCLLVFICLIVSSFAGCETTVKSTNWETLAEGLELRSFEWKLDEASKGARIVVLRIDPAQWDMELRAREWSYDNDEDGGVVAATNAGMFNTDYTAHIGFMKSGEHVNNPRILRNQYLSAALFGPIVEGVPEFQIADLDEVDLDSLKDS